MSPKDAYIAGHPLLSITVLLKTYFMVLDWGTGGLHWANRLLFFVGGGYHFNSGYRLLHAVEIRFALSYRWMQPNDTEEAACWQHR